LNPPENALVLCVDEKPGIQALDRTQPLLPTQTMIAALEIATGKVVAHVRNRRTSVNFLRFMNDVVRVHPHRELHVVVDNLNIHKNEAARRWLGRRPQVHFHYTPTHASWLNLIECFFSILSKQGLAHSVQRSKQDLKELLHRFLASYNETCNPFTWTKGPEHLQRNHRDNQGVSGSSPQQASPPSKRKKADSIRN
jgi:transposase